MTVHLEISPELQSRIDTLAAMSGRSVSEVIADALEHGYSLEWQEHYLKKVSEGIAAADRGDFAGPADIERVKNKYRMA